MFNEKEFRIQLIRVGISNKELAEMMHMDESTLYRKIKAGGAFTRDEINRLIVFLKIDNPKDIFFADELAETQDATV